MQCELNGAQNCVILIQVYTNTEKERKYRKETERERGEVIGRKRKRSRKRKMRNKVNVRWKRFKGRRVAERSDEGKRYEGIYLID